jgi:hypothetical protein
MGGSEVPTYLRLSTGILTRQVSSATNFFDYFFATFGTNSFAHRVRTWREKYGLASHPGYTQLHLPEVAPIAHLLQPLPLHRDMP